MKIIIKSVLLILFCLYGSFTNAQIVQSGVGTWRSFDLADPAVGPPWPYGSYIGQPAGWTTLGFADGTWNTGYIPGGGAPAAMWVDETLGQVHGALFRTNFTLAAVNGVFRFRVRPNNECEIWINGTQIGGLYNWSNGLQTVCVPDSVFITGNNVIAIQTTEWLDNATTLQFDLWNDAVTASITPTTPTVCANDAPISFSATPAGGTWSGSGITAAGLFTPSSALIGSNTLMYTVNTGPANCPFRNTTVVTVNDCCPDTCYWTLNGNSNVLTTNFMGAQNNADVKFRSNNIERMTIEANGNVGINTISPANRLEVTHGAAGNSGLRLTSLPNSSPSIPNPTNKVLSVDGAGDVILVDDGGAGLPVNADQGVTIDASNTVLLGDKCGNGGGQFQSDREINMNDFNLYFQSGTNNQSLGKIFMGPEQCYRLETRLEISSLGLINPVNDYLSPDPSLSGLRFTHLTSNTPVIQNQSKGMLSLDKDGDVIWVQAPQSNLINSCASINMVPKLVGTNTYGCSQIFDDGTSVGVNTTSGFGYTWSGGLTGPVLPPSSGTIRLDVHGVVRGLAYIATSDEKLKTNIRSIDNASALIQKMEGKKYAWNQDVIHSSLVDNADHYGFLAQELATVLPEAVIADEEGEFGVNYDMIIPILVESQKEMIEKIEAQEKQIEQLMNMLQTVLDSQKNSMEINLSNEANVILEQNVPNPFTNSTVIGYFLPTSVTKAEMVFTTLEGKVIKTVVITESGKGEVRVNNHELTPGAYVYSMIVNGKVIDSKKMSVN